MQFIVSMASSNASCIDIDKCNGEFNFRVPVYNLIILSCYVIVSWLVTGGLI